MKNLQAYREQLKELNRMIDQLERGELSIQDLLEMEKLTGELHARSIILRYKAFEEQVHGAEDPVLESTPEDEVHDLPMPEAPEEDAPAIDFSIFGDDDEEEPQVALFTEEPAEEKLETPAAVTPAPVPASEPTPEPISEPTPEPIKVAVQEKAPAAPVSGRSFWEQVKTEDDSLGSRFAGSKLDTLIGAFGLNEKLRYINELFDGSSELFSDAVKMLDAQADFLAATAKVNQLANEHGWDPEEESVAEFMMYVKRRYA